MKELRRRQADASSRRVPGRPGSDEPGNDEPDAGDDDPRPTEETDLSDADDDRRPDDPIPLRPAGPRGRGPEERGPGRPPRPPRPPRPTRGTGGPSDGGPSLRSRVTAIVAIVVVAFVVLMLVVGVQLWTDAIWFKSVGYDAVFWTRIGIQTGLFAAGTVIAIVVLWGTLWLAGRLAPPPADGAGRGGSIRGWIERLNEAAATAD